MQIETKRLYLRPLTLQDCNEEYVCWLNDPQVKRFLETRHTPQNLETVRTFVQRVNERDDEHLYGMFVRAADRHIGNIKLGPVRRHHLLADVSLVIGARDCWRSGYATEAIAAISRYAFVTLGLRKLSASMYATNQASCRAFLRVGYRQEGLRRAHYLLEGEMTDLIELGLLPEDLVTPV